MTVTEPASSFSSTSIISSADVRPDSIESALGM